MMTEQFPSGEAIYLYEHELNQALLWQEQGMLSSIMMSPVGESLQCKVLAPSKSCKFQFCLTEILIQKKSCMVLCGICMERKNLSCHHSPKQRVLYWNLYSPRTSSMALSIGYKLITCYEAIIYRSAENPFKGIIWKRFWNWKYLTLLVHMNSDEFSTDWTTSLVATWQQNDFTQMKAMKTVAKSLLVSFWGKFVPFNNPCRTVICHTFDQMLEYENNRILNIDCYNDTSSFNC